MTVVQCGGEVLNTHHNPPSPVIKDTSNSPAFRNSCCSPPPPPPPYPLHFLVSIFFYAFQP